MVSQLGRLTMSKDHSNHTRHAPDTPAVKRGSPKPCGSGTDTTPKRPEGPSAPCHPACLLFTITSEQDNGGHKARTIANSVSHLRMFRSTPKVGGARRDRTDDLKLAKLALSQLSYGPNSVIKPNLEGVVGLSGLEPLTSRLSGVCSNHLSYRPLSVRRP